MNNNIILQSVELSKTFVDGISKIEILRKIDFSVTAGENVAIVGASGSGKSTLLHLLGGLDKPSTGKIIVDDKDLTQLSEYERCRLRNRFMGFVYQFHHLLPEFTAVENVAMPLLIGSCTAKTAQEEAENLLELVGLKDRLRHKIGQLSGGERQRVAIARALIVKPKCVLADEPTGNLDPRNAEKVLQVFLSLQQTYQTSIVMVTHDMRIAKQMQRVLTLEEGKLVAI